MKNNNTFKEYVAPILVLVVICLVVTAALAAVYGVANPIIIENDKKIPVGFMGIDNQHLEMLFISNEERKKGLGKMLLKYGIENFGINDLAVNKQNPLAKEFYEHMGFIVYKQTETDEQGNPYPLLYMKRKQI